ncbi:hypothetical protein F5Y16DRAFT_400462 [Xylariaceae sp. FL0255]|nr:hypothetical protein F5Y16DRAFT_400462 [Xylariaceae sp. FL0255]
MPEQRISGRHLHIPVALNDYGNAESEIRAQVGIGRSRCQEPTMLSRHSTACGDLWSPIFSSPSFTSFPAFPFKPQWMFANRQICNEALAMFYGKFTWTFPLFDNSFEFCHRIGPSNSSLVRHVRLGFPMLVVNVTNDHDDSQSTSGSWRSSLGVGTKEKKPAMGPAMARAAPRKKTEAPAPKAHTPEVPAAPKIPTPPTRLESTLNAISAPFVPSGNLNVFASYPSDDTIVPSITPTTNQTTAPSSLENTNKPEEAITFESSPATISRLCWEQPTPFLGEVNNEAERLWRSLLGDLRLMEVERAPDQKGERRKRSVRHASQTAQTLKPNLRKAPRP